VRLPRGREGEKTRRASGPSLVERTRTLASALRRPSLLALRVLVVVAGIAGAVAMGRLLTHHLTTSKSFAIDDLRVEGIERLDREELLEAAGIDLGTNVFLRSPEEVRTRLLAHPWIASADVSRRLPNHFTIKVREREPVALLSAEACNSAFGEPEDPSCDEGPASAIYLISDEGTIFKRLEGEDPIDLPVITGIDRSRLASDPEIKTRVLLEVVALLAQYREAGLWARVPIGELHVEPGDGLSLYVGEALTLVRLGMPPYAQKLRRMKKVFDRLAQEQTSAEYVYLDNEQRPDRVTVRLR
jgi:cell division protein FtsQ